MKIGFDAKWYFNGPISGMVVVTQLIDSILAVNTHHDIVLFLRKSDRLAACARFAKYLNRIPRVELVFIPLQTNFINNMFLMPIYARIHKLNIVLYQNYVPLVLAGKIKNVAYIHDFLFIDYPQYFTKTECVIFNFMKLSMRRASMVVTISNSEKERIMRYNSGYIPVSVVHHGISERFREYSEAEKEVAKRKYNLPSKYLLFVGRINVRKNIETLLEALTLVDTDIPLVIIGEVDKTCIQINQIIKNRRFEKRLIFMGRVSFSTLVDVLAASHIFIFPSYAEGFGLPPLEAMKSGIPVVVSSTTSMPEVCSDAALYFSPTNKYELAEKINLLLHSDKEWQRCKSKGLANAENFSWNKSARELLFVLEQLK